MTEMSGIDYNVALNLNTWQRNILLEEIEKMEKEKENG
jgi:hypothetical protein